METHSLTRKPKMHLTTRFFISIYHMLFFLIFYIEIYFKTIRTSKLINCTKYLPSLTRLLVPEVKVILTRCRIGHSKFTHSYLLNNDWRPDCIPCYCNYSLKHILIDFVDIFDVGQKFKNLNNLYDLFTKFAGKASLKVLIEINNTT